MRDDKKDAKPEVEKVDQVEEKLSDDDLEEVTGGALPKWWLDGAAHAVPPRKPKWGAVSLQGLA